MSNWYSKVQTRYELWKTVFVPSAGNVGLRNWFLSVKLFGGSTGDYSPGFRKPPFPFGFHQWRIFWYYCFSLVSEEVWCEAHRRHRFRATGLSPKVLGLKSFCNGSQCWLLDSSSAARAAVLCRGHSCSANLADTITLFCTYTDNNNYTLKLLDKDLL